MPVGQGVRHDSTQPAPLRRGGRQGSGPRCTEVAVRPSGFRGHRHGRTGHGNDIDVLRVNPDGELSATPVVNSEPGIVPFAMAFDPAGDLVIAEAGPNVLATFGPVTCMRS
jgi:hypothetical protein